MSTPNEYAEHLLTTYLLIRAGGAEDATEGRNDLGPVEMTPEGVTQRMTDLYAGGIRALSAFAQVARLRGVDIDEALREAMSVLAEEDERG